MRSLFCAIVMATLSATPAPPAHGYRAEVLRDLTEVEKKIVGLATAMPAAKYSWRPAPGVRSVSEVYMHIAGSNYVTARFMGLKPAVNDDSSLERITDKERVVAELKRSFDEVRDAVLRTPDGDLDKQIKIFGNRTTEREVFLNALTHLHEHLGQSVAYARRNGIVPPWSAP